MRFLLRAIFFGILTGAFLFFFPFHFFIFPILFVFLMLRIFFRPWRWRHRYNAFAPGGFGAYGGQGFAGSVPMDEDGFTPATPIDGFGTGRRNRSRGDQQNINIQ